VEKESEWDSALVEAFYTNDPYYPRPNPEDPLYKEFSNGYLSAHPKESRDAIDVVKLFCVRSRTSSADVFPRIEFRYHSQVFTKVESYPFVVCSPSLFPCPVANLSLSTVVRRFVLGYLSVNSICLTWLLRAFNIFVSHHLTQQRHRPLMTSADGGALSGSTLSPSAPLALLPTPTLIMPDGGHDISAPPSQ